MILAALLSMPLALNFLVAASPSSSILFIRARGSELARLFTRYTAFASFSDSIMLFAILHFSASAKSLLFRRVI